MTWAIVSLPLWCALFNRHRGGWMNPVPGRNFPIRLAYGLGMALACWIAIGFETTMWIFPVIAGGYLAATLGHAAHFTLGERQADHGGQRYEWTTRWLRHVRPRSEEATDWIGLAFVYLLKGVLTLAPVAVVAPWVAAGGLVGHLLVPIGYDMAKEAQRRGWSIPRLARRGDLIEWGETFAGALIGLGLVAGSAAQGLQSLP